MEKQIITYNHYINILTKLENKGMTLEKANSWIQERFTIETNHYVKEVSKNRKLNEFF